MIAVPIQVDRVAEGLWQTISGIDGHGIAAHEAWVALPEEEKVAWRKRAQIAIADWEEMQGHR